MLRIEQRKSSGIWRIRGTFHGVPVDESARTRCKAEAGRIKTAREKQIFAQVFGFTGQKQNHTFTDAFVRWIESGGDVKPFPYFEDILREMQNDNLESITQGRLNEASIRVMPTQSNATRKRHFFTPVSVVLGFAAEEKMMPVMKIRRPSVTGKRPYIFTPQDFETLLDASGDFAPLLTFFLGTGGRTGEVMRTAHEDFSPQRQRVTFWKTKAGEISRADSLRARSVDMCNRTREALPERGIGRLWTQYAESHDGRFHGPATRMKRICRRLGWKERGPHTLRHTWASWQYAINPDPFELMRKGGWSDIKMVQNYVHLGTPDLAEEVRRFGWFKYGETGNSRAGKTA